VTDAQAIREEIGRRKITRLAHFTPMRILVHIATGSGLLSTSHLNTHERSSFTQQDLERLDGFPDHISCAVEYPNAYYVQSKRRNARGEERIFPDWVCLLLAPSHLYRETTWFCPHNASGFRGRCVASGFAAFCELFAEEVVAPRSTWRRQNQPPCCPTDAQAEVLIHRYIPLADVLAIGVETADQAADTFARLRQIGAAVENLRLVVAPAFYSPATLSSGLRRGKRPIERPWHPPGNGAPDES
jgi:hypothetical protein